MKVIRMAALAAALFVAPVAVAAAQQPTPPQAQGQARQGQQGGRMMAALLKGIDLSDAQKAQLDSIRAKYRAQMGPFTPGTQPDSATMQKRRELMQAQQEDIRAVLTPDQQKVYDQNLAEMRSAMQRRFPPPER